METELDFARVIIAKDMFWEDRRLRWHPNESVVLVPSNHPWTENCFDLTYT